MHGMQARLISADHMGSFGVDEPIWQSPSGQLLNVDFEAAFPLKQIQNRPHSLWRYAEALPVKPLVSFDEGFTPMITERIQGKQVHIKLDFLFTTGSYKDRGATVLMSKASQLGIQQVVQDSSGNAGCAIAAYAAKAGIACRIFLPENTSASKVVQINAYGADVIKVPGSRENTAAAALNEAGHTYYASHCYNPWFLQGTKTWAYEVCEQLGWKAPNAVVLPCGNGTLVLGAYFGFMDLLKTGIISSVPRIVAVQAENCSPLWYNFNAIPGATLPAQTIAEGIAIATPVRGQQILDCVKQSGGLFLKVSEDEIKQSWKDMARRGFFIEPTSAAAIAGTAQYVSNCIDDVVVTVFTGSGLKSIETGLKTF